MATAMGAAAGTSVLVALSPLAPPTKVYNAPLGLALAALVFSIVGAAILLRQHRNAVGWILLAAGTGFGITGLAGTYRVYALVERHGAIPGGEWATWISSWSWLPTVVTPFTFLFLIFPNGRLPSARWRPVAWYTGILIVGGTIASSVAPGGLAAFQPTFVVFFALFFVGIVACVAALVVRFQRSRGIERQQIKWLAYASAVTPFANLMTSGLVTNALPLQLLGVVGTFAIPIATGVAILRYHLYDIDVLIRRTLVYGVTSTAIAGLFYVSVIALQPLLRPLMPGSDFAVAASTLVSFALFQPIRRSVQDAVDRRFYRSRYDAERTVDVFADQLRDEVDLDTLRGDLLSAVQETMAPAHANLWLRGRLRDAL